MFIKKVEVVSLIVTVLLISAVTAIADQSNFLLRVLASDINCTKSSGAVRVGWRIGYGDGIDPLETGDIMTPPIGG